METKLNDNEVYEIAEMQRKIDSYEAFILAISFMIKGKKDINYPIFTNTELDGRMHHIWKWIKEQQ